MQPVMWFQDHGLETRVHSSSFCPGLGLETWWPRSRSWSRDLKSQLSVLVSRPEDPGLGLGLENWSPRYWSWSWDIKKVLTSTLLKALNFNIHSAHPTTTAVPLQCLTLLHYTASQKSATFIAVNNFGKCSPTLIVLFYCWYWKWINEKHHLRSAQILHIFSRDLTVSSARSSAFGNTCLCLPLLVLIYRPWRDGRLSWPRQLVT